MRESVLAAVGPNAAASHEVVLGILSLIVWALILIVTVKYILILLRTDNHGEGGTLALMALTTLETLGPLHAYGIARRIEQTSGDLLSVNYGTLYPALLKLEQEGYIASAWGFSDNNRRAKYYKLTATGGRRLKKQAREWEQTTEIVARFLSPQGESA